MTYILVFLHIITYANGIQGIDQKIKNFTKIASSLNINCKENVSQLVLLRWDKSKSKYKIVLTLPIVDGVFKGKNTINNGDYVEYNGRYNENMLSIKLQCFNKYTNNYIKNYEIYTQILIQNDPIYILGWSACTSDKRSMPEFICFVKNIRFLS